MSTSDLSRIIDGSPELPWLNDAACASLGVERIDMFFVSAGKSLSREAQEMCAGCPVKVDCLKHAYDRDIAGGYFGGVSPSKRKKLSFDEARAMIEAGS